MAASVVCGVDNSIPARVALRVGRRLADRLDLRLVLLHVSEVRPAMSAPRSPTGSIQQGQSARTARKNVVTSAVNRSGASSAASFRRVVAYVIQDETCSSDLLRRAAERGGIAAVDNSREYE